MATQFVIVKTAHPVTAPMDPLDLDNDSSFKVDDYRRMAEQMCSNVAWEGQEGTGSMFGYSVALDATDACLFITFDSVLSAVELEQLSSKALALGSVVLDAENAEMLSGGFDL